MTTKPTKGQFFKDINEVLFELRNEGLVRYSFEARDLIMMTVMHESAGLRYDRQMNGGPALGFINMEGRTHEDIFDNYLRYRPNLYNFVISKVPSYECYIKDGLLIPNPEYLVKSHKYAILMARMHYYRVPESIPKYSSPHYLVDLANYCKDHYNGPGKATPSKYLDDYMYHWLDS